MTEPAGPALADTPERYGRVTRLLHWTIAALILWQLVGMALKLILGRQPLAGSFVGTHQWVGTLLFGLIVLRVIWALANRGRRPPHGAGLVGLAARVGHGMLYTAMLLVPFSALLRAYGNSREFAPFGFALFPARAEEIGWMVDFGNAIHGELGWIMAALIAGHVIMVGVHEGMWRDGTLARMIGRARAA